jgi:ATP-dependent Lon protease
LNEKLLAAKRNNIKTVLIPEANEIDLKEIQDKVKEGLKIIAIEKVEYAIPYVFPDILKTKSNPNHKTKNRKKKTA